MVLIASIVQSHAATHPFFFESKAQYEAKITKIKKDATAKEAALKKQLEKQKANITSATELKDLKKEAAEYAENAAKDLAAAGELEQQLKLDRAALNGDNQKLLEQKVVIEKANERLEFREKIFAGSFFALIVSTIFGGLGAYRAGGANKLENRKKELEIAKLERELREDQKAV